MLINPYTRRLVQLALDEDLGTGDITAGAFESFKAHAEFAFLAKEDFTVSGTKVVKEVYLLLDTDVSVEFSVQDGQKVTKGTVLGIVRGPAGSILSGERTSLNFLQRLSGVATNTAKYVEALGNSEIRILDTRKTTPGWRRLEKYAVKCGGGYNHRIGLFDGVMLKDNHIDAAGSIAEAIRIVRGSIPITVKVEVETRTLNEVQQAIDAKADIIMLDNFDIDKIQEAVKLIDKRAKIEVSGGVNMEFLKKLKDIAIDYVSIGALTHHALGVDISLKIRR